MDIILRSIVSVKDVLVGKIRTNAMHILKSENVCRGGRGGI